MSNLTFWVFSHHKCKLPIQLWTPKSYKATNLWLSRTCWNCHSRSRTLTLNTSSSNKCTVFWKKMGFQIITSESVQKSLSKFSVLCVHKSDAFGTKSFTQNSTILKALSFGFCRNWATTKLPKVTFVCSFRLYSPKTDKSKSKKFCCECFRSSNSSKRSAPFAKGNSPTFPVLPTSANVSGIMAVGVPSKGYSSALSMAQRKWDLRTFIRTLWVKGFRNCRPPSIYCWGKPTKEETTRTTFGVTSTKEKKERRNKSKGNNKRVWKLWARNGNTPSLLKTRTKTICSKMNIFPSVFTHRTSFLRSTRKQFLKLCSIFQNKQNRSCSANWKSKPQRR